MSRVQMFVTNPVTHDARVLREAEALTEAGHEVQVVGAREQGTAARDRRDGVDIVRVDRDPLPSKLVRRTLARRRSCGSPAHGPDPLIATPALLAAGGRTRRGAIRAALGTHLTLAWLAYARSALAEVRDSRPDVVVAHDLDTLPVGLVAARRAGARLLYDSHELFVEHESEPPRAQVTRRVQRAVEGPLIRRADRVITVSGSIADELARRYGIARPGVVRNLPAWSGSSGPPVDLRERVALDSVTRIAIYVGGLAPGRGLEQLAASAAELPGVGIVFLGTGPPHFRETLRRIAGEAGATERVRVSGPVPAAEVTRWAAGADVGVVPYPNTCLNNYLSLPNKLFEYLAAGLPVVASDFPELRQVVAGHDVGATCDPEDPTDIARAVRDVVGSGARLDELRTAAARAAAEFSWAREKEVLLRVFEELAPETA